VSTLSDYIGRRVDMVCFQLLRTPLAGRDQALVQELVRPADGGSVVAGVQKLAQKVLMTFLLKRGSKKYRPDDGCDFMTAAARNLWRTTADVEQSFYSARLDVRRQIEEEETDDDPDDERYGDVVLLGLTLSATRVTLRVQVVSAAGTEFTFLTPITVPTR
jgi:hypothetical protein